MEPGDVVEVEISGLGRLANTVVDWDVDLSGPGDQLAGLGQHAARRAGDARGRGRAGGGRGAGAVIQLRRIDHVVPARGRPRPRPSRRWALQFGLTEVERDRPPRLPALRLRAVLAGADRAPATRDTTTRRWELRRAMLAGRRRAPPRQPRRGIRAIATARCTSATRTATGSRSRPSTAPATTARPPVARSTSDAARAAPPQARPHQPADHRPGCRRPRSTATSWAWSISD